jgi:cytochrome c-type biogenesis protein CcmF
VISRAPELRSEHRLDSLLSREAVFLLNNLVLVGLCFVIFWGTFFPLISEAVTGNEASVGPPWFDRYIVPLALVLVLLSGIGPVIAWRRATAANLKRNLARPAALGLLAVVALVAAGVTGSVPALVMFGLAAFVLGAVGQELQRGVRARRAMSNDTVPWALVMLIRRNRRRYGGYIVHVGVSVLFAGVAASSAFQDARDVQLGVGETARAGGYEITYVRPTGDLQAASNGRLEKIDLGAVMRVSRDGKPVGTLRTERSFFPSADPSLGPVSRFFEGEATSEVGLRAGLRRDIWSAISPNVRDLRKRIAEGDKVFTAAKGLPPAERDIALAQALDGLTRSYTDNPPPATFRLIVSPLVSWIWLGALVVFAGGLIALWPPAGRAPRPVAARYAARVARELGRA